MSLIIADTANQPP